MAALNISRTTIFPGNWFWFIAFFYLFNLQICVVHKICMGLISLTHSVAYDQFTFSSNLLECDISFEPKRMLHYCEAFTTWMCSLKHFNTGWSISCDIFWCDNVAIPSEHCLIQMACYICTSLMLWVGRQATRLWLTMLGCGWWWWWVKQMIKLKWRCDTDLFANTGARA